MLLCLKLSLIQSNTDSSNRANHAAGGETDMDVDPVPALSGPQPESRALEAPVMGDAVSNSNGQPGISGENGFAEDTNLPPLHISAVASELVVPSSVSRLQLSLALEG